MTSEQPGSTTWQRVLADVRTSVAQVSYAVAVARERRALMRLNDAELKDIGVSRADAYREGSRSLWDLPPSDEQNGRPDLTGGNGRRLARKRPVEPDCAGHPPPLSLAS